MPGRTRRWGRRCARRHRRSRPSSPSARPNSSTEPRARSDRRPGGNVSGRLEGKVALVTGGSRGIGRAICARLAGDGAAVVVNFARKQDAAADVVAQIEAAGGRALAVGADVSDRAAVNRMVGAAVREYGRIDILVNNAGILARGTALEFDEVIFDRMMAVNVKGIVHTVQAVAPGMAARRYGRIVNISSLAGLGTAVANTTPYALTKAAVINLTKRQAFELGHDGITVNAICPGFIATEMLASLEPHDQEEQLRALASKAVLNRVGDPDDIARVVLFLASDDASFVTGQALAVDGGRMDFLTGSA
ncbi:MAG: 3-oxoacyl-ACP reductase FabG [Acidobacteriota bacterium]|nr:3-oxoacyl-ACP reductase FabG [Acidobacteriota bacterium]